MSNKNKFFIFNKFSAKLALVFALFLGLLAFILAPSAKADFFDDLVDFLDPVQHIENIIDGDPLANLPPLPPLPDFSDDDTTYNTYNYSSYPNVSISANPTSVNYNGSSTIHWNSNYATSCNATGGSSGWSGGKNTSGTFYTGALTNTVTYYITCSNSRGSANDSVTVHADDQVQNPTVNINANPSSVSYNGSSTVTWNSNNATSCNATGGSSGWSGGKNSSGTFFSGNLTHTVTFYITCRNNSGVASDSVTVSVGNDNNDDDGNVSVNITADDTSVAFDDDTRIRWDSDNADYCVPSGGTNDWDDEDINTSGSFNTGSLDSDETFRITCHNNSDSATDSVTVRVDEEEEEDEEPEVTTRSATNVSSTSATLRGRVDGNGSSARAWFEYGTSTSLGNTTTQNSYGSDATEFSKSVSGLSPNTTYYFRAVAENSEDTVFGNMLSFNTGTVVAPVNNQPTVVIYADQTSIAYSSATTVRWSTTNATSCNAIGGSLGWAGAKEVSQGSFYTGNLTGSRTYTIVCNNNSGSSTDSVTVNVRGQVLGATTTVVRSTPAPTSLVLVNSSLGQPVSSMIDNTRPRPGDEINYTIGYQNIGTASITSVILQVVLPQEVTYVYASGSLPSVYGNTLIFNLGTLGGNAQGTVTIRVRVRDNAIPGTYLNFPATLSYINPAGAPQSVTTNASAQVWNDPIINQNGNLGASASLAGLLPTDIFGWLLLFVLIMVLVLLAKHLFGGSIVPLSRRTVTTYDDHHPFEKKTTTTTLHE